MMREKKAEGLFMLNHLVAQLGMLLLGVGTGASFAYEYVLSSNLIFVVTVVGGVMYFVHLGVWRFFERWTGYYEFKLLPSDNRAVLEQERLN